MEEFLAHIVIEAFPHFSGLLDASKLNKIIILGESAKFLRDFCFQLNEGVCTTKETLNLNLKTVTKIVKLRCIARNYLLYLLAFISIWILINLEIFRMKSRLPISCLNYINKKKFRQQRKLILTANLNSKTRL